MLQRFSAALFAACGLCMFAPAMAADKPYPIDEVHADSPLNFLEIWSPSQFRTLIISPDGKYFAGVEVLSTSSGSILHIIDRETMKVVHTEKFEGNVAVEGVSWFDNDHLLLSPMGKQEIQEGRFGYGVFMLNIHTHNLRPIYSGDTADYGGREGVQLLGKIDAHNYYMMVQPAGASFDKFPYVYLYRVNVMTGRATKIMRSPSRAASFIIKPGENGNPGEVTHTIGLQEDDYYGAILHQQIEGEWKKTAEYDLKKGAWLPVRWSTTKPDTMIWKDTRETSTPAYYWVNMNTGDRELIYHDPKVEIDRIHYDSDTGEAIAVQSSYDYPEWKFLNPDARLSKQVQRMQATFPGSVVNVLSSTADGIESVIRVSNDQDSGKFYLHNYYDDKIRPLLDPNPDLDRTKMPRMHAVNFKARDGMELVAYLTVPEHKPMKKLPLVVLPHGGPHGPRDYWGFNMEAATFANAGYAVLQINYRGSGGYGRDFQFQWYKRWGLEMQDDLEDGVRWALLAGIADPERVCIYGASYGGYAALMGVVKTPDLYKCAIGYVGVYDLKVQVEDSDTAMQAAGRRYLRQAVGTDDKDLAARSPTPNAHRIKAPVMLVHGMQDARVHPKNYWGMRDALQERNHRFETLEVPRTGHGARDLASHREIYCRMIDFLDRYIGPRNPDDAPLDCTFPDSKELPYQYYDGTYYAEGH